jgi:adenosylhomocysteine nucleosidase
VDADGMTAACATRTEARAARRAGLRASVVGIGARRALPDGPVLSFGLAGALHDGLAVGDVLDATRIVDADGATLWQGDPLGIRGARPVTILAAEQLLDDPSARLTLHRRTGADAADMESGALARTGRLTGCLRAVSDTPSQTLGPLAEAVDDRGRLSWAALARALGRPRATWRSLARVRLALRKLGEVTA